MRRGRGEMQVNVAGLRRNIKNLANNYTEAQKKVREATSNDPWGPSSTIMSEIADLTYNVVAFTEIMQMIWKRLNDHGRNWRHVYKALLLLEYLIKTGSEKVGQQCKENIFAIQTLRDFQYLDEGKDQGLNVREKAKQLVSLLRDDERLKNERTRALKAKERFAQTASGFGSDTTLTRNAWASGEPETPSKVDIMCARPTTAGEEELQLQLALAMSREEAEQEEQKRRSDDVRLQLAISQSQNEFKRHGPSQLGAQGPASLQTANGLESQHKHTQEKTSHMLDLLDVNLGPPEMSLPTTSAPLPLQDPWGMPLPPSRPQAADPWSVSSNATPATNTSTSGGDPWSPLPAAPAPPKPSEPGLGGDPWRVPQPPPPQAAAVVGGLPRNDPWSPASVTSEPSPVLSSPSNDLDEFDIISNRNNINNNNKTCVSPNPFDMGGLGDSLNGSTLTSAKKSPHSFLGENSGLVNLDNLITKPTPPPPQNLQPSIRPSAANPFSPVGAPLQPMRPTTSAFAPQSLTQANPFLS